MVREVLTSGYAHLVYNINTEYMCFGEINKISLELKANCNEVKTKKDKITGEIVDITYVIRE